ncbi:unnamed protein product [Paramecium primaurelia]|uniref:Uncharacterized protein n=1 Tax=Paramecium primaurelia TaxID=5886 RepID=A0A8S1LJN1_PARPR|nr:unnamed protein product [Paramecium primaurelia]
MREVLRNFKGLNEMMDLYIPVIKMNKIYMKGRRVLLASIILNGNRKKDHYFELADYYEKQNLYLVPQQLIQDYLMKQSKNNEENNLQQSLEFRDKIQQEQIKRKDKSKNKRDYIN